MSTVAPGSARPAGSERFVGVASALFAYGAWGIVPLYWKALKSVGSIEVLAHRVVWSLALLTVLVTVLGRWGATLQVLRSWRVVRILLVTTCLIAANWAMFIWAVNSQRLLEASLGYFINPLVNVLLGVGLLKETLGALQKASVALAALGVTVLTLSLGVAPWLALSLALSFGAYGLLRKIAPVDPLVGLMVETALCAPLGLAYVIAREASGHGALTTHTLGFDLLLVASGLVTALPLMAFTLAARRLPLSTLGLFQYISPTCQFLLAVFALGEPFGRAHFAAFGCIWLALGLFTLGRRDPRGLKRPHN